MQSFWTFVSIVAKMINDIEYGLCYGHGERISNEDYAFLLSLKLAQSRTPLLLNIGKVLMCKCQFYYFK